MDTKGIIENKLRAYGQEQLLTFWDELSEEQKAFLEGEINRVDFEQIQRLFEHRNDVPESSQMAYRCSEPVSFRLSDLRERVDTPPFPDSQYDPYEAREIGEGMLRHGRIAAAVVAGGQGTRLDFPHAKGFYPIGPLSNASLFQIHVERIRAVARKYNTRIPFLIQTSPATHDETIVFFREHENFGLPDEDVLIFCQGTMPSVRFEDGKIFLREKWEVAKSPDGHGGFLACANAPAPDAWSEKSRKEGVLADMESRGIEEIFYFQIDNPIIDIASPEFIGYHMLSRSEFSSQVVRKVHPKDRVGNMVMVDGRLHVIEYSDLPDDAGARRKPDGSLEIWAGSIAVHMMNVKFLRAKANLAGSLPFHIAKKKVPFVVTSPEEGAPVGTHIKPESPNAIKFEKFIFDLLPQANNPIVVEIDASTGFAPLKNHDRVPTDNPTTTRAGLSNLYKLWLNNMGIQLADGVIVEVSPLFANSAAELRDRLLAEGMWPKDNLITESVYWHE
ncbi:MAG: UTP--glucose-1-phosphate uridylyltransferase [Thermoguttaceae bacterium]|nr:UTP--glucose-1-phosphate uridylyltransferase [Thermoguttaceae bacterium]